MSRSKRSSRRRESSEQNAPSNNDWAYGLHTLEEMLRSQVDSIDEIIVAEGAKGKLARLAQEAQELGVLVKHRPRKFLQRLLGNVNFQGVGIKTRDFRYQVFLRSFWEFQPDYQIIENNHLNFYRFMEYFFK